MTRTRATEADGERPGGQLWPMGAVARRTGIGEHTLRAWERRFGFPRPVRLASGHRRYTGEQVQRLLLINAALACGHRASEVVPLPSTELEGLLRAAEPAAAPRGADLAAGWVERALEAVRRLDREEVANTLRHAAATLGLRAFLRDRVAPLLDAVGKGWVSGDLCVRHEHLASEVVDDTLRALRMPLESGARGRPVVLATLASELHGLGLQVVALTVAEAGRSLRLLGHDLPPGEIAQAAATVDAVAVALSVSAAADPQRTSAMVAELRAGLPAGTRLWVGGAGSARLPALAEEVVLIDSLDDLERALAVLP